MWIADCWKDYELIDAANGLRLERWGKEIFVRPDPMAIWDKASNDKRWNSPAAKYFRSEKGGGNWEFYKKLPASWNLRYADCTFQIKPMGFKHMGIFPEQAANWDWFCKLIKDSIRPIRVLNLFAYTGGATVMCAKAGAEVCHVDASKGIVQMARDNAALSGLKDHSIRYIVDDCAKFVAREIKRGSKYDGIIMDPPSYGRGPGGEIWKIEDELPNLLRLCKQVLNDTPLFVLLNSYTTGLSAGVVENLMKLTFGDNSTASELGIPMTSRNLVLPCGSSGRWEHK